MTAWRLGIIAATGLTLAPALALGTEACVVDTAIAGLPKTDRTCILNVGMESARFHAYCEAGKKAAEASGSKAVTFQITYQAKCPAGQVGTCEVDPPAGRIVSHFYDKKGAARAKASCLSGGPVPPGTWKDG